jgi:molecular chaperone Hsp33
MQYDRLQRFLLDNTKVRGEWVHLDETWQRLLDCANYPESIRNILGEALASVSLLAATIKFQGSLMMQINGEGPAHLLLVQATSEGTVRGLARWKDEHQQAVEAATNIQEMFGNGHIVITIDPTDKSERYQGVVGLQGESLADSLKDYFEQSEQLKTRLWLAADGKSAAGLLLQRLPGEVEDEDGWGRATTLADTLQRKELLELDNETLLTRLFHEEDVHLFDAESVAFKCSCSLEKVNSMVQSLGEAEANSIIDEQGGIDVTCEFCNTNYSLDAVDVSQLFVDDLSKQTADSDTLH